jgi:alpha-tubulin suppressor-like RCC1 family protein
MGSNDQPLAGATVQWSVTQGQATLEPAQSTTDAGGHAETRVTIGGTPGSIVVSAVVQDVTPVTFSITALDPRAFLTVSAGYGHTCGVTASGDAYCWGANNYGKLGDGSDPLEVQFSPRLVLGGLSFAEVSAGGHHTCGITTAGAAYCWGYDEARTRPAPVPVGGGVVFESVSTGGYHTCGVTAAGEAYCWGPNGAGELGDGTTIARSSPVLVAGGLTFASVGGGNEYTCGLTRAGAAYCWGANHAGQLGDGTRTDHLTPAPVAGGISFQSLGVSALSACGATAAGATYCWGWNTEGQLGTGTTAGHESCVHVAPCSAVPVPMVGGVSFARLGGGVTNSHSCGVTAAGAAYCWGWNVVGQLGDGTASGNEVCYPGGRDFPSSPCSTVPVPVAGGLSFDAVSAGAFHSCGVTPAGAVYCWGWNEVGQLGTRTGAQHLTPVLVSIE